MADNTHLYGFRWAGSRGGSGNPVIVERHVATGQNDQDDNSNSVDLRVGDPVKQVSTGGVGLALTTNPVWGIVMGVKQYWDGTRIRGGTKLPNQTAWGTVEARRSILYVCPVETAYWEIDGDDTAAAYDTLAEYQAFVGENANHVVPGDTTITAADPKLDMSSHATTGSLTWRIERVSGTAWNEDFSGANVKLIVTINDGQYAGAADADELKEGV